MLNGIICNHSKVQMLEASKEQNCLQKNIFMVIHLKNQAIVLSKNNLPWCSVRGSGVLCLLSHEELVSEVTVALAMRSGQGGGGGIHGCITSDSVRRHSVLWKSQKFMEQKSFTIEQELLQICRLKKFLERKGWQEPTMNLLEVLKKGSIRMNF